MPSQAKWRVPFKSNQINRMGWITISLGIESFAINVWSYARQIVPVDTGSLMNSIRIMKYSSSSMSNPWVRYQVVAGAGNIADSGFRSIGRGGGGVGVGSTRPAGFKRLSGSGQRVVTKAAKGKKWRNPYYALYVELGTSKMKAQPFMRPAFNKYRYKLKALVRKAARRYFR